MTARAFYVCLVALLLIPAVIKKSMGEMPIISYLLTASVFSFIIVTMIDLATSDLPRYAGSDYLAPIWSPKIISAISILSLSFYYQTGVFPAYASMKEKSTDNFMCASL